MSAAVVRLARILAEGATRSIRELVLLGCSIGRDFIIDLTAEVA